MLYFLVAVAVAMMVGVVVGLAYTSARSYAGPGLQGAAQPAPQSAKQVRGATPYIEIKNEPAPKLIVDEALPDGLPQGIVWIQYRTETCHIVPVFGKEALKASTRICHLHVQVDDLPWLWADASDSNTVDIGGMPPGEHKVTISLVDPTHQDFQGQSKTVKFTVPVGIRTLKLEGVGRPGPQVSAHGRPARALEGHDDAGARARHAHGRNNTCQILFW